jgi:hypothetical protein
VSGITRDFLFSLAMTKNQPASGSVRKFLQQQLRDAAPDSLETAVLRHLTDCVERFGEGAFSEAAGLADRFAEIYMRSRDITRLNDAFRKNPAPAVVVTAGMQALGEEAVVAALEAVRDFDAFTADNDPWGEHDFGSLETAGQRFFWKIDCYDRDLRYHSPDPTDPEVTVRVLTLMLPEEY